MAPLPMEKICEIHFVCGCERACARNLFHAGPEPDANARHDDADAAEAEADVEAEIRPEEIINDEEDR